MDQRVRCTSFKDDNEFCGEEFSVQVEEVGERLFEGDFKCPTCGATASFEVMYGDGGA